MKGAAVKLADFGLAIEVQAEQQAWFGMYCHCFCFTNHYETLNSKALTPRPQFVCS